MAKFSAPDRSKAVVVLNDAPHVKPQLLFPAPIRRVGLSINERIQIVGRESIGGAARRDRPGGYHNVALGLSEREVSIVFGETVFHPHERCDVVSREMANISYANLADKPLAFHARPDSEWFNGNLGALQYFGVFSLSDSNPNQATRNDEKPKCECRYPGREEFGRTSGYPERALRASLLGVLIGTLGGVLLLFALGVFHRNC